MTNTRDQRATDEDDDDVEEQVNRIQNDWFMQDNENLSELKKSPLKKKKKDKVSNIELFENTYHANLDLSD